MNLARRNPIPYYQALLADNDLVEVRHKTSRWRSYWFNDPDRLVSFFRNHDEAGDLYTNLRSPDLRDYHMSPVSKTLVKLISSTAAEN